MWQRDDTDVAGPPGPTDEAVDLVRDVVTGGGVSSVYQPVVDLVTDEVVGYEALARGPVGTPLERPAALFNAARRAGCATELDWACRASALQGAIDARLTARQTLFVNVDPATLGRAVPGHLEELVRHAEQELRVVLEFSQHGLTDDPAAVLATVERVRAHAWGLAMDDVGVDPASLALLPLVRPDVLKLAHGLLAGAWGPTATGRALFSSLAAAETTGASVLVQGVESEDDVLTARGLGIRLGQGHHLGVPGPLPRGGPLPRAAVPLLRAEQLPTARSAFDHVSAGRPVRRANRTSLVAMSRELEELARSTHVPPVVLSACQDARHVTPATAASYETLAEHAALVALFGVAMPSDPVPGVRGVRLDRGDRLAREWVVVVVSPYVNAALVAREVGAHEPGSDGRFDCVVTHDRSLVVDVAQLLLRRVHAGAVVEALPALT